MGLFDFFKKKQKGIEINEFNSPKFQQYSCALALWSLKENNLNENMAIRELLKIGLNNEQANLIVDKTKKILEQENKDAHQKGIGTTTFHNETYRKIAYPDTENNIRNTDFGISDDLLDRIVKKEINEVETKKYFDKLFSLATFQSQNGKHENALTLFQKCLIINPNADEVYCNLSILNYNMNDFQQALDNINRAINLNPSIDTYYKNKAITCEHMGLHREEKKCYEKIIQIDPKNVEAIFSLSQLNVQDNEFETALINLNKVIDYTNESAELFGPQLSKIGVLYELGFFKEAEDLYITMSSRFPEEITIHHIIPNIQFYKNKTNDVIAFFDKQFERTKNTIILKSKADFFFDKDKTIAIASYDEYLAINPKDIQARQNRLILYSETNKVYDTNLEIEEILSVDPNNVNALFNKMRALISIKSYEEALKITEKIYATDHSNMNFVSYIIDVLDHFKSENDIENYLEKLKTSNPDHSYNIEYKKGLYFKSKGFYDNAIQVFNTQNKIHEFSWNYYQMAIMKNLQGKTDESIELLKTTFKLEPGLKEDAKKYPELQNLWTNPKFIEITK